MRIVLGFFTIIIGIIALLLFEKTLIMASILIVGINALVLLKRKSWFWGISLLTVAILGIFPPSYLFLRLVPLVALFLGIGMVFNGYGRN